MVQKLQTLPLNVTRSLIERLERGSSEKVYQVHVCMLLPQCPWQASSDHPPRKSVVQQPQYNYRSRAARVVDLYLALRLRFGQMPCLPAPLAYAAVAGGPDN